MRVARAISASTPSRSTLEVELKIREGPVRRERPAGHGRQQRREPLGAGDLPQQAGEGGSLVAGLEVAALLAVCRGGREARVRECIAAEQQQHLDLVALHQRRARQRPQAQLHPHELAGRAGPLDVPHLLQPGMALHDRDLPPRPALEPGAPVAGCDVEPLRRTPARVLHRQQELVLAGHVPVERHGGEAEPLGDALHGDRAEPVLVGQLHSARDDALEAQPDTCRPLRPPHGAPEPIQCCGRSFCHLRAPQRRLLAVYTSCMPYFLCT